MVVRLRGLSLNLATSQRTKEEQWEHWGLPVHQWDSSRVPKRLCEHGKGWEEKGTVTVHPSWSEQDQILSFITIPSFTLPPPPIQSQELDKMDAYGNLLSPVRLLETAALPAEEQAISPILLAGAALPSSGRRDNSTETCFFPSGKETVFIQAAEIGQPPRQGGTTSTQQAGGQTPAESGPRVALWNGRAPLPLPLQGPPPPAHWTSKKWKAYVCSEAISCICWFLQNYYLPLSA